jgi:hypothetical protein
MNLDWRALAKHRHNVSVLAGAAGVLAVPYLYASPQMIHYGAAAVLASGVVAGVVECVRWLWHQITS